MSSDMCLIDGCRSLDEIGCFRSMSDDMTVICVHAARKDRYDRIIARGREDVPESIEEFDQRDRKELEWGIGEIIALSDIVISNDSDLESFRDKIDHVFKTMGLV